MLDDGVLEAVYDRNDKKKGGKLIVYHDSDDDDDAGSDGDDDTGNRSATAPSVPSTISSPSNNNNNDVSTNTTPSSDGTDHRATSRGDDGDSVGDDIDNDDYSDGNDGGDEDDGVVPRARSNRTSTTTTTTTTTISPPIPSLSVLVPTGGDDGQSVPASAVVIKYKTPSLTERSQYFYFDVNLPTVETYEPDWTAIYHPKSLAYFFDGNSFPKALAKVQAIASLDDIPEHLVKNFTSPSRPKGHRNFCYTCFSTCMDSSHHVIQHFTYYECFPNASPILLPSDEDWDVLNDEKNANTYNMKLADFTCHVCRIRGPLAEQKEHMTSFTHRSLVARSRNEGGQGQVDLPPPESYANTSLTTLLFPRLFPTLFSVDKPDDFVMKYPNESFFLQRQIPISHQKILTQYGYRPIQPQSKDYLTYLSSLDEKDQYSAIAGASANASGRRRGCGSKVKDEKTTIATSPSGEMTTLTPNPTNSGGTMVSSSPHPVTTPSSDAVSKMGGVASKIV